MKKKKITVEYLKKMKVPSVLIAGIIIASVLGWTGWSKLKDIKNYYQIKKIFPEKTVAVEAIDGDTFTIKNGLSVRLVGINAPGRGNEKYLDAKNYLNHLLLKKTLYFEYDTYQDDKFGRILAYVWIDCNFEIQIYCRGNRALVNEVMIKKGLAEKVIYSKRKKLRYDDFLNPPRRKNYQRTKTKEVIAIVRRMAIDTGQTTAIRVASDQTITVLKFIFQPFPRISFTPLRMIQIT